MDRRQVLRLAGGGIIAAAMAGAGCDSRLPSDALVAWQAPNHETDVRRWILSHAILAPHSHNLQSWLIDLQEPDVIVLRLDMQRLLPQTDPQSRQMVMSQGTFVELIDQAARQRGYRAEIQLFPEGVFKPQTIDGRPTARIRLVPDANVRPDPLFAQVFRRRTNRKPYDAQAPEESSLDAIRASVRGFPVDVGFTDPQHVSTLQMHRDIAMRAWSIELATPRTLMESYRLLRIGPEEIAKHRDGIALNDPMVRVLTRLGLFDRSRPASFDSSEIRDQVERFESLMAATPAFFWMVTQDNDRTTQLLAGRAYVRAQLAATAEGLAMHPLQQALQEYPEQANTHAAIHRLLGSTLPEQTVQMWTRLGYGPAIEPAPRRGLQAHLQPKVA